MPPCWFRQPPTPRSQNSTRATRRRESSECRSGRPEVQARWRRFTKDWKIWQMGFIAHGHESFYDVLFEGLREYGYEEGRNLIVERRYARGQAERFKEFAAEMVRLNVDIIIVVTTPADLAVKKATTTIPIVHPNAIDPLNTGLIAKAANTLRRHQHLLCDSSCLIITVSEFR